MKIQKKKLFLYELGTAIHLNWKNKDSGGLFIYRGQPIRKKISDVREAWTVDLKQSSYFDRKLCISDSKNRIVALDCSKGEIDNDLFFCDILAHKLKSTVRNNQIQARLLYRKFQKPLRLIL
ncbi:hypothetical protein LEP1GSC121_0226 [Leptospira borgpetersenii serovar Castellonis str. 200801910]|nr:Uncharacterized protein LB4E_3120 [Leptospira borgpetersenii str. 4E]EKR00793.1 hypothetical protein LEP1GSC121_0226 [Leptospira borgpetersenii serovar Castellonis str. 200801910]